MNALFVLIIGLFFINLIVMFAAFTSLSMYLSDRLNEIEKLLKELKEDRGETQNE